MTLCSSSRPSLIVTLSSWASTKHNSSVQDDPDHLGSLEFLPGPQSPLLLQYGDSELKLYSQDPNKPEVFLVSQRSFVQVLFCSFDFCTYYRYLLGAT
jgi:hypothetical protein